MEFINLDAWPRETGKTQIKRLRREGKVPAVAYGHGVASRALSISPKALITAMQGPYGRNAVLQVMIGQERPFPALVCDFSVHPVTRELVHVDLLHIDLAKEVDIDVPMRCVGKPIGVVEGGVLRLVFRTLPLRCLPENIPAVIEHDVTELKQGDTAKTADLTLPEGVKVRLPADQTVIAIVAPEVEKVEEPLPGAVVPGVEGAPMVAAPGAAPAEGAAPAAPAAAAPAPAARPAKEDRKKK